MLDNCWGKTSRSHQVAVLNAAALPPLVPDTAGPLSFPAAALFLLARLS
jgi:hypothetical protein